MQLNFDFCLNREKKLENQKSQIHFLIKKFALKYTQKIRGSYPRLFKFQ